VLGSAVVVAVSVWLLLKSFAFADQQRNGSASRFASDASCWKVQITDANREIHRPDAPRQRSDSDRTPLVSCFESTFIATMGDVGDVSNDAKKLKQVVQSFAPSQFRPSYWTSNCHFQTIYGSGAIQTKLFGLPTRPFTTTPERFDTLDNDFFDVEYTEGFDDPRSDKSVIIVHGLESSIQGRLVTNFATAFIKKGFTCCLFSFRSCNGVENRYECHAVLNGDISQALIRTVGMLARTTWGSQPI
jgi:hypothetical protein